MPAFLSQPSPRWVALCLAATLAASSTGAFATVILVVTDSHHPVKPMGEERVVKLDEPIRIEAELSAGLPNHPERAAALAQQRLNNGELQRRLVQAYQVVADAWGLGIAKVPAVVVDRRYVVYGEPDVARAVARIEAHRRSQP
jgi:integrating conjugative element protein (TIGR03757 family)